MQIRKYEASSVGEALRAIRKDLGPDAFILSTREKKNSKEYGMFSKPLVEVTAALNVDDEEKPDSTRDEKPESPENHNGGPRGKKQLIKAYGQLNTENKLAVKSRETALAKPAETQAIPESIAKELNFIKAYMRRMEGNISKFGKGYLASGIHDEFSEIKMLLMEVMRLNINQQSDQLPESLIRIFTKLKVAGIKEVFILDIIKALKASKDPFEPDDKLLKFDDVEEYYLNGTIRIMLKNILVNGGIKFKDQKQPKMVVFKGPSGSGKTTTLAKIAANFALRDKKQIGIISLDNFRIAASEQLKTFASIIGAPIQVVAGRENFAAAVRAFGEKDLILVDTPGQGIKDSSLSHSFIKDVYSDVENYLVLSASSSIDYLESCVGSFQKDGIDGLIFTFLDDAPSLGSVYNIAMTVKKPLAYFSFGQKVPEDLAIATKERIVEGLV